MNKENRNILRRSKQYTGCWTCRRRGIKCDELKPFCRKCELSDINCEGYQIRLCWENNIKADKPRFDTTRSFVLNPWDEADLLDNLQIDYYLEKIDIASSFILVKRIESESDSFTYGPFHVFKAATQVKSAVTKTNGLKKEYPKRQQVSHSSEIPLTAISNDAYSQIFYKLQSMGFSGVGGNLEVELFLIQYWINDVTRLFVPTVGANYNPYKMLSDLVLEGKDSYATDIRKITLHSFCSISASFLSIPGKSLSLEECYHGIMFENYWKFHKSRSFDLIAYLYSSKESFEFDELCMLIASMLLLLTLDVFHPTDQWQVHLKGLLSVFKTVIKRMEDDQLNPDTCNDHSLYEILAFFGQMTKISYIFGTLAHLTNLPTYKVSMTDFAFLNFPTDKNDVPLLYKNHGISESMLECLTDVVECLQLPDINNKNTIISNLSRRIMDSSPLPLTVKDSENLDSQIRYHQSNIFYIALKLYFLREVIGERPSKVQDLVDIGIDHIEQCLKLLTGLGSTGLLWPYFVICCETMTTSGQEKIERWFDTTLVHQITTIDWSIQIIRAVWSRRLNEESVSWIAVKQDMNPALLLN